MRVVVRHRDWWAEVSKPPPVGLATVRTAPEFAAFHRSRTYSWQTSVISH
jgi:hypothetical protein